MCACAYCLPCILAFNADVSLVVAQRVTGDAQLHNIISSRRVFFSCWMNPFKYTKRVVCFVRCWFTMGNKHWRKHKIITIRMIQYHGVHKHDTQASCAYAAHILAYFVVSFRIVFFSLFFGAGGMQCCCFYLGVVLLPYALFVVLKSQNKPTQNVYTPQ